MVTVTIPTKISKGSQLIAIPKRDYDMFKKWREEVVDAMSKVKRGRAEYKNRKTVIAGSPHRFR